MPVSLAPVSTMICPHSATSQWRSPPLHRRCYFGHEEGPATKFVRLRNDAVSSCKGRVDCDGCHRDEPRVWWSFWRRRPFFLFACGSRSVGKARWALERRMIRRRDGQQVLNVIADQISCFHSHDYRFAVDRDCLHVGVCPNGKFGGPWTFVVMEVHQWSLHDVRAYGTEQAAS